MRPRHRTQRHSTVADMMREAIRHQTPRGVLIVLDGLTNSPTSAALLHHHIQQTGRYRGIVLCAPQYLKKRIERGVVNNRKGYREIYTHA